MSEKVGREHKLVVKGNIDVIFYYKINITKWILIGRFHLHALYLSLKQFKGFDILLR